MDELRNKPHPLELEQWLLAEQSANASSHVESKLTASSQEELRHEDQLLRERLLQRMPPARFARIVAARAEAEKRARPRAAARVYVMGAALTAAAALVVVFREPSVRRMEPTMNTERAKGVGLDLRVYRQQGSAVERLTDGAQVAPHQVVQLGYARGAFSHGVLLSIDGRGAVTLHYPRQPGDASLLPATGEQVLAEAYELDDAPAFERFIFVGAKEPLPVQAIVEAARLLAADAAQVRTAPIALGFPNAQRSLLLHKSTPR